MPARNTPCAGFAAIGEGVPRVGTGGASTRLNGAACALFDLSREQALGQPFARVLIEGERRRVPIFTRLQRPNGETISIVDSASPRRNHDGRVCATVFGFRAISNARRLTQELSLPRLLDRRGFEQTLTLIWHRRVATMSPCW